MEGMGKCIGVWGEVREGVLGVCGSVFGVWRNVFGMWGKVWKRFWGGVKVGGARKCGKKYGTIWESGKICGEG